METRNKPEEASCFADSLRGPRPENQDNYLLVRGDGTAEYLEDENKQHSVIPDWKMNHTRLVVADGMGGHNNGRQAAEAVIRALLKLPFQSDPHQLKKEIISIHTHLFEQFHQGARTPGSTLVMADINDQGQAVIANIGDSRAYLYSGSPNWEALTRDHTTLEFAWRDGEIGYKEYCQGLLTDTNRIVQAVGFGSSGIIPDEHGVKLRQHVAQLRIEPENKDIITRQLNKNDVLMLASDGLWSKQNNYSPDAMDDRELRTYAETQLNKAVSMTGDNITLLLFRHTPTL